MGRFRSIWDSLYKWRQDVPIFLDWDRRNSAIPSYLKQQRAFLEMHFRCLEMRINLAIAHLDPLLYSKPSTWEIGNAYPDALKAIQRILEIIETQALTSNSYHLYHWDAVRATTTLLEIFLRNDFLDSQISLNELMETYYGGIRTCRKLVIGSLAKVEDTMDEAFNRYEDR
jgi:hypothetical protein